MNETQTRPTKTAWKSHLNNWSIYAAAAGASLSMATGADAGIISGSLNLTVSVNPNNGSVSEFQLKKFNVAGQEQQFFIENHASVSFCGGSPCSPGNRGFGITHVAPRSGFAGLAGGTAGGQLKFFVTGGGAEAKFALGAYIGGSHLVRSADFGDVAGGVGHGPWGPNASGYVGFESPGGDLGWLKVVLSDQNNDGYPDEATLVDYAYNSVSGAPIKAGEVAVSSTTPEPGTAALGLLAAGAMGILALRRRRRETASN